MKTGLAIAQRREEIGMTQDELAKAVGVSKTSISRWESGDISNMRRDRIQKLAEALRVSPLSLLEEETDGLSDTVCQQPNAKLLPSEYIRMIPCFESASAGFGTDAQNRVIDFVPLYIVNEHEAAETICITVRGDSMHPRIEDGDIVQVHKQDTAETGDIVVILDGDEAFVKRFIHGKNGVILESFNPAYPPMKFTKEESNRLRIVGVVKRIIRNL
jgi:repressor LexA